MDAATVGVLTGTIGVVGTLVGVVFTQWRADVREGKRLVVEERREQQRLDRDAARELVDDDPTVAEPGRSTR